ncbi:MAG TPA: hypothetical protein VK250_10315 [Nitrososphaeraceae archaeon]|nr:hypothetical protein [Nitrososphaeraceae archaeon]
MTFKSGFNNYEAYHIDFLSLFATSLPIISFSQMDYSTHPTITRQIPSANTQSQPSYHLRDNYYE